VRATLSLPPRVKGPFTLVLEGRAVIDGRMVARRVVPAEDMMQAFLYRHLTPSQEMMVAAAGGRRPLGRPLVVDEEGPVRIPAGGVARVHIVAPPHPRMQELELELSDSPPGITLQGYEPVEGGLAIEIAADEDLAPVGLSDNLIVEASIEVERRGREGSAAARVNRVSLGVLPAIPFEVVRR
jgi:hypothetical protein